MRGNTDGEWLPVVAYGAVAPWFLYTMVSAALMAYAFRPGVSGVRREDSRPRVKLSPRHNDGIQTGRMTGV